MRAVIYGGGTFSHVRPHLSLAAKAFGTTARRLAELLKSRWEIDLRLTKMAGGSKIETTEDLRADVMNVMWDEDVQVIIMSAAVCDFKGFVYDNKSHGYGETRLDSSRDYKMDMQPLPKIIRNIRGFGGRKDIFLVGFKTTWGATNEEMVKRGLELLKTNSCNLVLANDIKNRMGVVVTPELAAYGLSDTRETTLEVLADLILARAGLTYTRTEIKLDATLMPWASVPPTLKVVVDYCIGHGAYKPFLGVTSGHFGFRARENVLWSSRRKKNYNKPEDLALTRVEFFEDRVTASKERPSVGARSQLSIMDEEFNCVVHFHCPMKPGSKVHVQSQFAYECGSHECGRNTLDGLREVAPGIKAVMLAKHGPNIVFNRGINPKQVISFIERNFDLGRRDPIQ